MAEPCGRRSRIEPRGSREVGTESCDQNECHFNANHGIYQAKTTGKSDKTGQADVTNTHDTITTKTEILQAYKPPAHLPLRPEPLELTRPWELMLQWRMGVTKRTLGATDG